MVGSSLLVSAETAAATAAVNKTVNQSAGARRY